MRGWNAGLAGGFGVALGAARALGAVRALGESARPTVQASKKSSTFARAISSPFSLSGRTIFCGLFDLFPDVFPGRLSDASGRNLSPAYQRVKTYLQWPDT